MVAQYLLKLEALRPTVQQLPREPRLDLQILLRRVLREAAANRPVCDGPLIAQTLLVLVPSYQIQFILTQIVFQLLRRYLRPVVQYVHIWLQIDRLVQAVSELCAGVLESSVGLISERPRGIGQQIGVGGLVYEATEVVLRRQQLNGGYLEELRARVLGRPEFVMLVLIEPGRGLMFRLVNGIMEARKHRLLINESKCLRLLRRSWLWTLNNSWSHFFSVFSLSMRRRLLLWRVVWLDLHGAVELGLGVSDDVIHFVSDELGWLVNDEAHWRSRGRLCSSPKLVPVHLTGLDQNLGHCRRQRCLRSPEVRIGLTGLLRLHLRMQVLRRGQHICARQLPSSWAHARSQVVRHIVPRQENLRMRAHEILIR